MFLRLSALTALLAALPSLTVRGGQIPLVNGVYGGVGPATAADTKLAAVSPAATTPGKLRVVENSGVCETTPGVYQASGYGDLTSKESIWYAQLVTSSDGSADLSSLFLGSGSLRPATAQTLPPSPFG